MEETVRVCTIENEAESEIVCSILDEQGIPYTLHKSEDSVYDGIYAAQGPWAIIEAPLPYSDSIVQIVKDVRESRAAGTQTSSPNGSTTLSFRRKVEIAIPILMLLAVIVLLGIVVSQKRRIDRYASGQFVVWRWDPGQRAMVGRLKSTGQLRYMDYDRNFDNVYEERVVYSLDGKRLTTYYDDNGDGYPQRSLVTRTDGTIVSEGQDLNENGVYEREVVHHGAGRFVEYEDVDDDGLFDIVIVHNSGTERTIDLRKAFYADQP